MSRPICLKVAVTLLKHSMTVLGLKNTTKGKMLTVERTYDRCWVMIAECLFRYQCLPLPPVRVLRGLLGFHEGIRGCLMRIFPVEHFIIDFNHSELLSSK